jgi:hypothetical protein
MPNVDRLVVLPKKPKVFSIPNVQFTFLCYLWPFYMLSTVLVIRQWESADTGLKLKGVLFLNCTRSSDKMPDCKKNLHIPYSWISYLQPPRVLLLCMIGGSDRTVLFAKASYIYRYVLYLSVPLFSWHTTHGWLI